MTIDDVPSLDIGATAKPAVTVVDADNTEQSGYTLAWTSDNPDVAAVDASTGTITAVAPGTAIITAAATLSDGTQVTGTTEVTVKVPDVSVTLPDEAQTVTVGKNITLTPTVSVTVNGSEVSGAGYTLAWTSDSPNATVDSAGKVTGVAVGTANISVSVTAITIGNVTVPLTGESDTAQVTVEASNEPAVTLDKTEITLDKGSEATVAASVVNSSAAVTWTSSNTAVATVDANGKITAVAPGTATIIATLGENDSNGQAVTAAAEVTVTAPVVLTVSPETLTIGADDINESVISTITYDGTQQETSNAVIEWTSSNEAVATVDSNGKITAVAGGSATITATVKSLTVNGESVLLTNTSSVLTDTVTVNVIEVTPDVPDSVALTITTENDAPALQFDLAATVVPSGIQPEITYTVSGPLDSTVATVNIADGKLTVTGSKVGATSFTVTATATLSDGTTVEGSKTVGVRVTSDALKQDQAPQAVGREASSYTYKLLDAAGFNNAADKKLVISFDKTGSQIMTVSNGSLVLAQSTITQQVDGTYTIENGQNYSVWTKASSWNGLSTTSGWLNKNDSNEAYLANNGIHWNSTQAGDGITLNYNYSELAIGLSSEGKILVAEATSLIKSVLYIFSETEVQGAQLYAALYCKDYSIPVTEYSGDLLSNILAQCYILEGTAQDLSGDTKTYYLDQLDATDYSYSIYRGSNTWDTVTEIDSLGTYTVTVKGKNVSGNEVTLGSFTITIEPPQSIALSLETDGTMVDGKLSLGTGKTASVSAAITVTMADGTVVPDSLLTAEVTIADNQYSNIVTFANGVVTGTQTGEETITATLVNNSLKINGIEVYTDAVSNKNSTASLTVNVHNVPTVSLDTSNLKNEIALDVTDEPTSQTFPLACVTDYLNELGIDVSDLDVSYQIETDSDAVTVEKSDDGTSFVIKAAKKGTANVTVTLSIAEEYQDSVEVKTRNFTTEVTVTDNRNEPYEITVSPESILIGVNSTKNIQVTVKQGTRTVDPSEYSLAWSSNAEAIATVSAEGVITGAATGTAAVSVTVTDNVNSSLTDTAEVTVKVADLEDLYVLAVDPEEIDATLGTSIQIKNTLTFEGDPCTDTVVYTYDSGNESVAVVDENGKVTLLGSGNTDVTVTATITREDGTTITKTETIPVKSAEPVLTIGTDYSNAAGSLDEITVSAGTTFTVTPHVDLSDWLTSYTVSWEVTGPDGNVTVTQTTYGGPLSTDTEDGIQSIGDAEATITVGTGASLTEQYTVRAWLSEINGIAVTGKKDEIKVNVVSEDAAVTLNMSTLYSRETKMYDRDPEAEGKDVYEFRIKDAHTFLPDSYGLDARIIAVQGDKKIDFSQVTLNVYKNGQLVLDENGDPVEIPASELSYYDVSTDKVGWVKVRVTYKDYYDGTIPIYSDKGATETPASLYDEYTTGEDGGEGYVWMYVREKIDETRTATIRVGDKDVKVTMHVTDIRPWIGQGKSMTNENAADVAADHSDGGGYLPAITFTLEYDGKTYTYVNGEGGSLWGTYGILDWKANVYGAMSDVSASTDQYEADSNVVVDGMPALGYIDYLLYGVTVEGVQYKFDEPLTIHLPTVVREDSLFKDSEVTFGYTQRWGGTGGFAYKSFLGGAVPISSYAISYNADLTSDLYNIGIVTEVPNATVGVGTWHEWFSLNAPLGTANIASTFHSITRNDGVVLIFDPEDKTVEPEYTISLDPQMLILSTPDANIDGTPNTGTLVATVRDKDGNLIGENVNVEVQWTIRNAAIATADVINATTGMDQSSDGSFTGPHSQDVEVTGQKTGVTYLTVQLMKVGNVDVSQDYIADYSIIYVIDKPHTEEMNIVVDYGKPIDIDIHAFTDQESDYDFIGFSDLEHSLRQHAYTHYGEIEIVESAKAVYTLGQMMNGVDPVYVIFQYVNEDNVYSWHHYLINIIPATNVYYETDFAEGVFDTYQNGTAAQWATITDGDGVDNGPQDDGTVGVTFEQTTGTSINHVYGYDSTYADDNGLSNGSSLYVEGKTTMAQIAARTPSTYTTFEFVGTGFDIISRTNENQGTIRVWVYDVNGNQVRNVSVINKGVDEMYQIPVVSVEGLTHGTYTVKIAVYDKVSYGTVLSIGNQFYFDAIRIYGPINTEADTEDAQIAANAYAEDSEANPVIYEVGQTIINAKTFDALNKGDAITGVVYMDGNDPESPSVADYDDIGANNEVYLTAGNGIAFKITSDTVPTGLDIGAKLILKDGKASNLSAMILSGSTTDGINLSADISYTIATCTQQYYDIKSQTNNVDLSSLFVQNGATNKYEAYLVIWNNGGEGILSVTDVKLTTTNADNEVAVVVDEQVSTMASYAMRSSDEYDVKAASFTCESAKVADKAQLTVITTQDVVRLEITDENGNLVESHSLYVDTATGDRVWTVTLNPIALGEQTFTVTGYNAEGEAGSSVNATVMVTL